MGLQSNFNQLMSVAGLLISQSPKAERFRAEQRAEAEEPLLAQELEHREKIEKIKTEATAARQQEGLKARAEAREQQRQEKIRELRTAYEGHKKFAEAAHGKILNEQGRAIRGVGIERQYETRKKALASAEKLYAIDPTDELAREIETWQNELVELEPKALKKQREEQDRIARSNEITRSITGGNQ